MKTFLTYITEYLTADQRKKFEHVQMAPWARAKTDPVFGENQDSFHEPVEGYYADKSDLHKEVEKHIGKRLSSDEYRSGYSTDKYGRDVRLSKLIKDPDIQKKFAADTDRSTDIDAYQLDSPVMKVVRGTGVAGQTNPVKTRQNPEGHSWHDISCKNIEDGLYNEKLKSEIHHGSVVAFVKDQHGQELYRATLHPHHNSEGDTVYALDGEYGLQHPKFTAHVENLARRLSGKYNGGHSLYTKNPHVYNDGSPIEIPHPNLGRL